MPSFSTLDQLRFVPFLLFSE
uniref:Uncharacterized protein n=1 Tax=Arundo donax TaxID=35708 RepID=A0A0A9AV72_ARUDO